MSEYILNSDEKKEFPYENGILYSTSSTKFHVGGKVVLTLMTLSVASSFAKVQATPMSNMPLPYNVPYHQVENIDKTSVAKSIMIVPKAYTLQQKNEEMLRKSFFENCDTPDIRLTLSPVFNFLAQGLKELFIKKVFVDVVPSKSMIDINLNLGHKILLSVSKSLPTISDDNVNFAISIDGELHAINQMSSTDLIKRMKDIQYKLSDL